MPREPGETGRVCLWVRTIASFLLIASLSAGAVSARYNAVAYGGIGRTELYAAVGEGVVWFSCERERDDPSEWGARIDVWPRPYRFWFRFAGAGYSCIAGAPHRSWTVEIPLWAPALLTGVGLGVPRARRWTRRSASRCLKCDYPLAHLAPGAPCPECGQRAAPPRPAC
jgi:hypothetical protein